MDINAFNALKTYGAAQKNLNPAAKPDMANPAKPGGDGASSNRWKRSRASPKQLQKAKTPRPPS